MIFMSMYGRKWQPTPIVLPGEFHGQRNLAGYSPWGRKESDMPQQLPLTHSCNFTFFVNLFLKGSKLGKYSFYFSFLCKEKLSSSLLCVSLLWICFTTHTEHFIFDISGHQTYGGFSSWQQAILCNINWSSYNLTQFWHSLPREAKIKQ